MNGYLYMILPEHSDLNLKPYKLTFESNIITTGANNGTENSVGINIVRHKILSKLAITKSIALFFS